ncbi:MAG: hypothetical protein ACTSO3_10070 [Candidatus Heimdallarchaeaceae archaeon]
MSGTLILFYSERDKDEVTCKERIAERLEKEKLEFQIFDITQKYTLYGNTFTYENSFIFDHCENGETRSFITPLLQAGKRYFKGEEEITENIPYLKIKYGR